MCGYFANIESTPDIIKVTNQLDLELPMGLERAYQRTVFNALVTSSDNKIAVNPAMWWYALKFDDSQFKVDDKITSFNARDLNKPLWSKAFQTRRALVFATEVGESENKQQYLMQSKTGFALGCVYQDWQHTSGAVARSFAVITRDPNKKYSQYHSKSTPLFLPLDKDVLNRWLEPTPLGSDLNEFTNQAVLTCDFDVTPVQSYKHSESLLPPFEMKRDE